jgi:V/A-type H+-transporting ATPase subunit I
MLFGGILLAAGGVEAELLVLEVSGAVVGGVGLVLLAVGLVLESGHGAAGLTQAGVELVDAVIRVFSNIVSFTRLAAFGLMHAALGLVVFEAASALWGTPAGVVTATIVFVGGNAVAFALEALVTGVQALRFAPWSLPVRSSKEAS